MQHAPDVHTPPKRKIPETVIVVAAPSGAGKTTFTAKLIAGELPEVLPFLPQGILPTTRYDIKGSVPYDDMAEHACIVLECCIDKNSTPDMPLKAYALLSPLINEANNLIVIALKSTKQQIAWQYFSRMWYNARKRRKHDPFTLWGLLHIRKYRTILKYRFSSDIDIAYARWQENQHTLFKHAHKTAQLLTFINDEKGGYLLEK